MVIEAGRVAVGTAHIAVMNVAGSLIPFIFTSDIARLLTPSDAGLISLMLSTISIFKSSENSWKAWWNSSELRRHRRNLAAH